MIRRRLVARARAAMLAGAALLTSCTGPSTTAARLRIPHGSRFSQVIDSLIAHQVITNRIWFRVLARIDHADRAVRPGLYDFPAGTTPGQALEMLRQGQTVQVRFTLPEGLTLYDAAALASLRLGLVPDSFVVAARDSSLVSSVGLDGPTFEGFLRPETYQLDADITARDLVRHLGQQFVEAWNPAWDAKLKGLGVTRRELVTMASIVEGEAQHDEDRPIIAGVYWNRWKKGMPLQADPTIEYAITLATGARKKRLYEKDYGFVSLYNTYLHAGLPPGPISSPGRESIEAALNPADVPYFYFVADADGRHRFSRTYAEHLRTIREIRRGAQRR